MVYFGSNCFYVLVGSPQTNVLPGLGTCVSVLAGGQRSTVELEHYLIGVPSLPCKLVCPCLLGIDGKFHVQTQCTRHQACRRVDKFTVIDFAVTV